MPSLMLAQFLGQPPPTAIPGPPVIEQALLESPWQVAVLLAAIGLAAFFALNRSGRVRLGAAVAGAALLLAGGVVVLASVVTTDREVVAERMRELVAAVAKGDAAGTGEYLAPALTVRLVGVRTKWGKDEVLGRVERELNGTYRLKDGAARVRELRASNESPSSIKTQARVTVTPENFGLPTDTWWLLTWRKGPDGAWRVIELDVQQIEGVREGTRIE